MNKGVLIGAGVVGLGALAIAASPEAQQAISERVETVIDTSKDWMNRVIARVSAHEGRHDSLNLNADGAGLSFGILQWAQKPGTLGGLLTAMYQVDPARFAATFGPSWAELLQGTLAGSIGPVGGAVLWQEPWISRFKAAGRDPVFIDVQNRMAAEGDHFKGALRAAEALGFATERTMALLYDTSVQQGPGFAKKLAVKVRNLYAGKTADVIEILTTYAQLAPAHFRRTSAPTEAYPVSHIEWRKVGSEWHAWAGSFDLYAGILKRRMGIVADPGLGDGVVRV